MSTEDPFGKRVGGALCLDFVNTVHGRVADPVSHGVRSYADRIVGERLVSYQAFLRWAVVAGVLTSEQARLLARTATQHPARALSVMGRSHALREAVYRLFKAAVEGWPPRSEDLDVLNRELQRARAHERLLGSPSFRYEWDESESALDRPLWPIARSAADLLTSSDLQRVRQCPGEECGWLFLDTSRSRRRQWCDMGECGNLAKVRRFRQKHGARMRRPETGASPRRHRGPAGSR